MPPVDLRVPEISPALVVGYVLSLDRKEPTGSAGPAQPTNLLWGAVELARQGHDVRYFYPASLVRGAWTRWRFLAYFVFLLRARRRLAECDVLYVSAYYVILAVALGKFLGLIRADVIVLLAAIQLGLPRGRWTRPWLRIVDRWTLRRCAFALYLTAREAEIARDYLGLEKEQLDWIRLGVDADFYPESAEPKEDCVVAIGNDGNRDWAALACIAARLPAVKFKVLTQSARLRAADFPANVELCTGLGLAESRDALARARAFLLTTKPNIHFSGMTTVMNAMLVGTPVVLDEALALADYRLNSGENCLAYPRGDDAAAAECVRQLFEATALASRLRTNALLRREDFSMTVFAATLAYRIRARCRPARRPGAPTNHLAKA